MSFSELSQIERLARIGSHFDGGEEPPLRVNRWGPASWWRAGIAVFAVLIALFILSRWVG